LNAYEQIGETIPQLLQYEALFVNNVPMQRVLALMYTDILEFHRRALVVFKRKCKSLESYSQELGNCTLSFFLTEVTAWRQLFRATWKDFSTHFSHLLVNLRRHKGLIESQAQLNEIECSQASRHTQGIEIEQSRLAREAQEKHFSAMESSDKKKQYLAIVEKISPASVSAVHTIAIGHWKKAPGFGQWLLGHEKMKAWLDAERCDSELLWLKGIPGAGKFSTTTLYPASQQLQNITTIVGWEPLATKLLPLFSHPAFHE
jgi:hypothetical protein